MSALIRACGLVMIPAVVSVDFIWRLTVMGMTAFYRNFPEAGQFLSKIFNTVYAGESHKHILITLPYSHFCEKVRWACELTGEPIEERGYAPMFHSITMWHTGKRMSSTPVMITSQNKVLPESTDIMHFLKEKNLKKSQKDWLFPCKEAIELDDSFSKSFGYGHAAFCIAYYYLYTDPLGKQRLREAFQIGIPTWQASLINLLWPTIELIFTRFIHIKERAFFQKNQKVVNEVWEKVENLLADGRKNICNTPEISGADIAFAALSYPLVLPPEMEERYMSFVKGAIPKQYYEEVEKRRNTVAGKFILQLYREHRHSR